jgi:hypothetical protein
MARPVWTRAPQAGLTLVHRTNLGTRHLNSHTIRTSLPTPNPSPLMGLRLSKRNLLSNAWLMIEWHGLVSSWRLMY